MSEKSRGILFGAIIIAVGILAFLDNLGLVPFATEFLWAGFLLVLACVFALTFYHDRSKWWTLVLAGVALFLSFILLQEALPFMPEDILGSVLFWIISAIFIVVYAQNEKNWWAIIPAGIFLVLGVIVVIDELNLIDSEFVPFILLLGIGLTFGFLYSIRDDENRLGWALYPAVGIILFSFFVLGLTESTLVISLVIPVGFILGGAILIYRALR